MADKEIKNELLKQNAAADQTLADCRAKIISLFNRKPHTVYNYLFCLLDDLEDKVDDKSVSEVDFIIHIAGINTVVSWVHERILENQNLVGEDS